MFSGSALCRKLLLALSFMSTLASAAEPVSALRVGIVPYLSPNVLMSLFAPVRNHLHQELKRPIELYTTTDVQSFVKKTMHPDYDILISSAHLSRLAQNKGGYLPVAQFSNDLYGVIFVASNSAIHQIGDLRGKRLAITDRSILVNIAVFDALSRAGIAESQMRLQPSINQNTSLLSIAQGENDAAITAHFSLDQMPAAQRGELREIFRTKALPNVIVSVSPNRSVAERNAISHAMLTLPDTKEGAVFLKTSRFGGVKLVDDATMKALDTYLPETLRHQGQ